MSVVKTDNLQSNIKPTNSTLTFANRWDHFLARWGVNRMGHRIEPGLYTLGSPTIDSPVLVTANYTLSFDALRSALAGVDCYIMVLDTQGVNVWCAAGKGTFGTDEVVSRIEAACLPEIVRHRILILPQLGSAGVAAHEVKQRSGFKVEYGPIRASDLPEYLQAHRATQEMRQVRFGLRDRLAVIPVEVVHILIPMSVVAVTLYFTASLMWSMASVAAFLAGTVLFPILLPFLPTRDFSTKGFILGVLVALPFALLRFANAGDAVWWHQVGRTLTYLLIWPTVTAFLALDFTGSTTFTSRTRVRREIFRYIPIMAAVFGTGIALSVIISLIPTWGRA